MRAALLLLLACGPATTFECEPAIACVTSNPKTKCDTHYQYPVVIGGWCDPACDGRSCIGETAVLCLQMPGWNVADWVEEKSARCQLGGDQ